MKKFTSFINGLKSLNISLSENQLEQFYMYYELLIEKNKVMNLTAITEYEDVIHKHFLDSLSIVLWKRWNPTYSLIDIGSGAGFPGIPIKIAFSECNVILMDSLNKRVLFLNEVIEKLGLENIKAVHGRAEDMGMNSSYREQFDLSVSRAVANMSTLLEYCVPFVKVGGYFISYKSGKFQEEIVQASNAIQILNSNLSEVVKFKLPGTEEVERVLVATKKNSSLSSKYPRKAGLPSKEPLK